MNFLALLLGLATERMLTHLFHLREFRWLDPLFDQHLRRLRKARRWLAVGLTLLLMLLLVAPVAAASLLLWDEFLRIPYFLCAVVVLLFSLGPRDLDEEVEGYLAALESGDLDTQRQVAEELLERAVVLRSPDVRNAHQPDHRRGFARGDETAQRHFQREDSI